MHRSRPTAILLENIRYGILVLRAEYLHPDLLPCAETESSRIHQRYLGYPTEFLRDAHNVSEVRKFATDNMLWREGEIDVTDFSRSEQEELLKDYGYKWDDFSADIDRNQIICENHFEQYLLDYRNDI